MFVKARLWMFVRSAQLGDNRRTAAGHSLDQRPIPRPKRKQKKRKVEREKYHFWCFPASEECSFVAIEVSLSSLAISTEKQCLDTQGDLGQDRLFIQVPNFWAAPCSPAAIWLQFFVSHPLILASTNSSTRSDVPAGSQFKSANIVQLIW